LNASTLRARALEHLRSTAGGCATAGSLAEVLKVPRWRARVALQALERQGLADSAGYGPYPDLLPQRVRLWVLP
jgi:DNA-binding IclR family transcriptional regulator